MATVCLLAIVCTGFKLVLKLFEENPIVCVCHWRWECKSGWLENKNGISWKFIVLQYRVMWINTRNCAYSLRCRCGGVSGAECLCACESVWIEINVYACDLRIGYKDAQNEKMKSAQPHLIKDLVLAVNPFVLIITPDKMCVRCTCLHIIIIIYGNRVYLPVHSTITRA